MKVLSIDAWAGMEPGLWEWNDWFTVGRISKEDFKALDTNRKILKWFRDEGYTKATSQGLCGVEDFDQYNLVITDRRNGKPLYAIEYGSHY